MSINAVENSGNQTASTQNNAPAQEALRRAARQFEAVLLMQLTSALSGTNTDEDSLFGNDGGSDLAKKMFSEQLATTMAESGGIGLSDIILRQFGVTQTPPSSGGKTFNNAISAVKDIKISSSPAITNNSPANSSDNPPIIYRNGKIEPVTNNFSGNPKDAEIISRFEDQNSAETVRNRWGSPFMPDVETPSNNVSPNVQTPSNTVSPMNPANTTYQMPVNGRISSNFGNRFHPIDKVQKFHAGMDIAAPTGTPIGSAADGVVTFAGERKGYGKLVIVQHPDGRETRYGHASKIFVNEGDKVAAGQTLAAVGSTGKSTGPHLHFEVRENGQAVNPRSFLSNVLGK